MKADRLINAEQLARYLGQSPSSIYALARSGVIPSYKAGPKLRGRRFDPAEVKESLRHSAVKNRSIKTA